MTLSAQSDASWSVFLGAALALTLSAALGVLFGDAITRLVPTHLIHLGAGAAFIVIGTLLMLGRL
ncbi:MAG: TMEM165/GDT1 family protein [Firmicutes bacterium]|nr:TMEM165/GDT1 family protein [Alicyclobacillaceae bacterium]MCL6498113.1 TMEM165/GDT1 family protein [Bacillota bacterium]